MAETYGQTWRKVRLYVPAAPALLVKDWVLNAYREGSDEKNWSFLRGEGEFLLQASRNGVVVVVQGSATVTGAGGSTGMTFVAGDVGRQFRGSSIAGPPLTITAVSLVGNTSATLERVWDDVSSTTLTGTITDIYATCPADFGHFLAVLDPQMQRQIRIFATSEELNQADPGRMSVGVPWALVNYRLSTIASTLGRVQYEWWPYFESSGTMRYPFYYIKRAQNPAEDDYFGGPWRDRSDVILLGALAQAAEWPGAGQIKNPYFNLQLATKHRERFRYEMGLLEVKDEEMYLTWWNGLGLQGGPGMAPLTPMDAKFAQSHE